MKSSKVISIFLTFGMLAAGCQQRIVFSTQATNALNTTSAIGNNVIPFQVGNCPGGYTNEPCVNITICTPGTSACQTITNILLDTGSYGLRIFQSAMSIGLNQEKDSLGRAIAQCSYFGSDNTWGPVELGDVELGGETAHSVPIQMINKNYASVPSPCTAPDGSPSDAGFNGILGVGLFVQDCGSTCVTDSSNQTYYACTGSNCVNIAVTLAQQVSNPVASLPLDNNGVILQLPAISTSGQVSVSGSLILGIGTQADNMPGAVKTYPADQDGNFITTFQGQQYTGSFIDSGSNGLFFPTPTGLTTCSSSSDADGFFCPTSIMSYSGTQEGASGSTQNTVSFQIMNAQTAFNSSYGAFNDVGGPYDITGTSAAFDWGLPFFFGRTVYVGIDSTSSSLGTGPYWAY